MQQERHTVTNKEPMGTTILWQHFDWRHEVRNFLLLLLGSLISAASISIVYVPLNMSMGGVSGIATILYILTGEGNLLSLGTFSLLLNIPILLFGWRFYGFRMVYRSLIGTLVYSAMIDFTEMFMGDWYGRIIAPMEQKPDPLVFAIVGGVAFGIGLGLIFRGHYTTGGSDIIAIVATKFMHHITIGQFIFAFDIVVVLFSVIIQTITAEPNIMMALYAFVALFLTGRTTDIVLVGTDSSRACFIISEESDKIAEKIMREMDRGLTALHGKGAYTGKSKEILLVVLTNREVPDLKKLVLSVDAGAFLIVVDANDVAGEGFGKNSIM